VGHPECQRGEGNPSQNYKSTSQLEKTGAVAHAQQPGVEKLVKVVEGGKLHRRGGKTHLLREL
jgi:hypothetical protein